MNNERIQEILKNTDRNDRELRRACLIALGMRGGNRTEALATLAAFEAPPVVVDEPKAPEGSAVAATIRNAIEKGEDLTIEYQKTGEDSPTTRQIGAIVWNIVGESIVCSDLDKGAPRSFRLDRIVSATPSALARLRALLERATPPTKADLMDAARAAGLVLDPKLKKADALDLAISFVKEG